jgi:ketosteroid isomerase-like protein
MFPPDQPPVVGRAAIREYIRQAFATPHFSVSWTTDTVVVAASGDMAYSFSRSRYTFPGRSGARGAVDTVYGKGMNVWRREADGRWRAAADIWNGAPVLPPIHPVGSSE